MSFVVRASRAPAAARYVARPVQLRGFAASSARALKETARDEPDEGERYERAKQDQIRRQKEGTNFWKPELASESEESVHADREAKRDLAEMQRETKDMAEKNYKAGTSQDSGLHDK